MVAEEHGPRIADLVNFRGPAEVEISLSAHFWPPHGSDSWQERELERLVDHYVVGYEPGNPGGSLVGIAHRLMEGLRLKREQKAVTPIVGGYGTGKSYLALMLAVLISREIDDPLVAQLLRKMRRAVGDDPRGKKMVNDLERWIRERPLPYLAVPLVFDRDAAISLFHHVVDGVEEAISRWPGQPSLESAGLRLKRSEARSQIQRWEQEAPNVAEAVDGWLQEKHNLSLEDIARDMDEPSRADEAVRILSKAYEELFKVRLPLIGVAGIRPFLEQVVDAFAKPDKQGIAPPFEGIVILLDEFHHYLDVQALRLSAADPGSRLDLQEFAGAVRRRAEYLGLVLLSPTGLVDSIDRVAAGLPEGEAAGDLRRFKERLGEEVRLTYRHFLDVATSFLRHKEAWDLFAREHRSDFDEQARWLLDRLPSECEGAAGSGDVRSKLVEPLYPLHPLAALLLCRYLVDRLEQHRTLGKMFVPQDGELAAWAGQTPALEDGRVRWFTALDVIRFYRNSLTDHRFLDTWQEAEAALPNAVPEASDIERDTLLAVTVLEGLPLPWPSTVDVLARMTGRSEHEVRRSLDVLATEGLLNRTNQGLYRLDIGRRKTRIRYEEELKRALGQRPATRDSHPSRLLNEHLAGRSNWMAPANIGLPPASTPARSGDSPTVQPETFLRRRNIITDGREWSWRMEYVSPSVLDAVSLQNKAKAFVKPKGGAERSGVVLRVLPADETELAQARQQLGALYKGLEGQEIPEWMKRVVIVCPDAPVDVVEPLERLYVYGELWKSSGLATEFADMVKSERQSAADQLQEALEVAYTAVGTQWLTAPDLPIEVDTSQSKLREHGVVSQILARRFTWAPPMPQALSRPSLEELIPALLRNEIAQAIRNKKKQSKPRLITDQVLKAAWQVLDPTDLSLRRPPEGTATSFAYQQLDTLWTGPEGDKQTLLWSDAGALLKEPYGYGEQDTWRLLIACYLGWCLRAGGRLESLERRSGVDNVAAQLTRDRDGAHTGDAEQIIDYFTNLKPDRIGVVWTPTQLLKAEKVSQNGSPTGSSDGTSSGAPSEPPHNHSQMGTGVEGPTGTSTPPTREETDLGRTQTGSDGTPQTSVIESIFSQFDTLNQEQRMRVVDELYHRIPKDVREAELLEAWIDEG